MKSLTVAQAIDTSRLASPQAWLFAAKIIVKNSAGLITDVVRIVRNDEDISIGGEVYKATPFEIEYTQENNEMPSLSITMEDQLRVIQSQLNQHRGIVGSEVQVMVITPDTIIESYGEYNGSYPLPQVGEIIVGGKKKRVRFPSPIANPVVIPGAPTRNDSEFGVARISSVSSTSFEAEFLEWPYLDGDHAPEHFSYLALPEGVHSQYDGSVWEVGTTLADGHIDSDTDAKWSRVTFASPHVSAPKVFAFVQGSGKDQMVVTRVKNVTADGFDVGLQFQQSQQGTTAQKEVVGWLAISNDGGGGQVKFRDHSGSVFTQGYTLQSIARTELEGGDLGGFKLYVEEEGSSDSEVGHASENVAVLNLGNRIFACMTTFYGQDPASVRRVDLGTYQEPVTIATVEPDLVDGFTVISAQANDYVVSLELGAENPLRMLSPKRTQMRNRCSFRYKSAECGYAGANPTCDLTLGGDNGCVAHGNEKNYGGFPGIKPRSL